MIIRSSWILSFVVMVLAQVGFAEEGFVRAASARAGTGFNFKNSYGAINFKHADDMTSLHAVQEMSWSYHKAIRLGDVVTYIQPGIYEIDKIKFPIVYSSSIPVADLQFVQNYICISYGHQKSTGSSREGYNKDTYEKTEDWGWGAEFNAKGFVNIGPVDASYWAVVSISCI